MEQILEFIQTYGLPVFVIASCIIALLGVLKLCKVFSKIKNANAKKFIYYMIDIVLSFGGVALFFVIFHIEFNDYLTLCITQVSATTTLYAVYENLGARKLVEMFWSWFGGVVEKDSHKQLIKFAKSVGLDNAIEELKKFSLEQATKLENQKVENGVINASQKVQ